MSTTILAFHGDAARQQKYIDRVEAHYLADEIKHGTYASSETHSYCGVGCIIHDPTGGHARYPEEIGAPVALAYLQDRIFESLPKHRSKEWARDFIHAIPLGGDLSGVIPQFMAWLMDDPTYGVAQITTDTEIKDLALEVARRYRTGEGLEGPEAKALADKLQDARAALDARAAWAVLDAWAALAALAALDARAAWAALDARAAFIEASASELLRLLAEAPVPEEMAA